MAGGQDSGAPVMGEVTPEDVALLNTGVAEARAAAAAVASTPIPAMGGTRRVFVADKAHANHEVLVKAGKIVQFANPLSPTGETMRRRDGDVWVKFKEGVLVTDDPEVIAWCEAHPTICRDANDPSAPAWAAMKELLIPLASRDAMLDHNYDVDSLLPPGASQPRQEKVQEILAVHPTVETAKSDAALAEKVAREREGQSRAVL